MTIIEAYQILGISDESPTEEIKTAYRRKAHELHPDKYKSNQEKMFYSQKFKELKEAYELVRNKDAKVPAQEIESKPQPVPRFGRRSFSSQEQEPVSLPEKLGIHFSWNTESLILWVFIIPAGVVVLGLVIRFFATLINR